MTTDVSMTGVAPVVTSGALANVTTGLLSVWTDTKGRYGHELL